MGSLFGTNQPNQPGTVNPASPRSIFPAAGAATGSSPFPTIGAGGIGFGSHTVSSTTAPATTTPAPIVVLPGTRQNSNSHPPVPSIRRKLNNAPVFGDSSFTVLVGPPGEQTEFSLHQDLASKASSFFEAAFRNEWTESGSRIVHLPEHAAEHFQIFFLWMYTRQIFSCKDKDDDISRSPFDKKWTLDGEWNRLAYAWTLGAYLQATDFKDAVVDAVIEKASQGGYSAYEQNMHEVIYAKSMPGAPIRGLLVDIAAWRWNKVTVQTKKNDSAWSDFFQDLSVKLMDQRDNQQSSPLSLDPCIYHEHRKINMPCYSTKTYGLSGSVPPK